MTRKRLESALQCGAPFGLRTKDGREFNIEGPERLFLPDGVEYVLFFDHAGHLTVLPLTLLAGLSVQARQPEPIGV